MAPGLKPRPSTPALPPQERGWSRLRLIDPELVDLDATLEYEQAAAEPDDDRHDELLEQELTAVDVALAGQTTLTPSSSVARFGALDPAVTALSGKTKTRMRFAAACLDGLDVEHWAPRVGRRGIFRIASTAVLAGLTGSLIGWYVASAWLV